MWRRFVTWWAGKFGLEVLPTGSTKAAVSLAQLLNEYAQRSGALNEPKRIKARGRVIASTAAIIDVLTDAEPPAEEDRGWL